MENQEHRTSDLLVTLSLALVSLSICVYILGNNISSTTTDLAISQAEDLSIQILSGGLNSLSGSQTRGPASAEDRNYLGKIEWEGVISNDPWGHPFHYKVGRNERGYVSEIFVISGGPNGKIESDVENLQGPKLNLKSDDLGFLKLVSN